jgi:hypothetical protein
LQTSRARVPKALHHALVATRSNMKDDTIYSGAL